MRAALWQATAVSLAAHAVVLSQLRAALPEVAPHGVAKPPVLTATLQPPAAPTRRAAPAQVTTMAAEQREAVDKMPKPHDSEPPRQDAAPPTRQEEAAQDPPYLSRGQLTVPPRPLGIVQVAFPEEVTGVVDLKVRLTVFIDEAGTVQHVRLDTPNVHPAFERAVRDTFTAARFSPGEVEHVAVRSQIRVEVEFRAPPGSGVTAGSRRSPS